MKIGWLFNCFLEMHHLVWARALCGTRIGCCVSVDCSGVIRKIHVSEIDVDQDDEHTCHHDGFQHLGTFDAAPGTLQSPEVRADAQCRKITWLDELASERNTIQV